MLRDECFHFHDVGCHDLKTLRQRFDILKTRWTLCISAEGFFDRLIKLSWQCSLQHDHRNACLDMFKCDLNTVSGMRIDSNAVIFFDISDCLQAISMHRLARNEAKLSDLFKFITITTWLTGQIKTTFFFDFMKQGFDSFCVTSSKSKINRSKLDA